VAEGVGGRRVARALAGVGVPASALAVAGIGIGLVDELSEWLRLRGEHALTLTEQRVLGSVVALPHPSAHGLQPAAVRAGVLPVCARPGCPCTSTWDGEEGGFCCRACREGTPCERNYHPTPFAPTPRATAALAAAQAKTASVPAAMPAVAPSSGVAWPMADGLTVSQLRTSLFELTGSVPEAPAGINPTTFYVAALERVRAAQPASAARSGGLWPAGRPSDGVSLQSLKELLVRSGVDISGALAAGSGIDVYRAMYDDMLQQPSRAAAAARAAVHAAAAPPPPTRAAAPPSPTRASDNLSLDQLRDLLSAAQVALPPANSPLSVYQMLYDAFGNALVERQSAAMCAAAERAATAAPAASAVAATGAAAPAAAVAAAAGHAAAPRVSLMRSALAMGSAVDVSSLFAAVPDDALEEVLEQSMLIMASTESHAIRPGEWQPFVLVPGLARALLVALERTNHSADSLLARHSAIVHDVGRVMTAVSDLAALAAAHSSARGGSGAAPSSANAGADVTRRAIARLSLDSRAVSAVRDVHEVSVAGGAPLRAAARSLEMHTQFGPDVAIIMHQENLDKAPTGDPTLTHAALTVWNAMRDIRPRLAVARQQYYKEVVPQAVDLPALLKSVSSGTLTLELLTGAKADKPDISVGKLARGWTVFGRILEEILPRDADLPFEWLKMGNELFDTGAVNATNSLKMVVVDVLTSLRAESALHLSGVRSDAPTLSGVRAERWAVSSREQMLTGALAGAPAPADAARQRERAAERATAAAATAAAAAAAVAAGAGAPAPGPAPAAPSAKGKRPKA
jgi:hypothetical protein